jgi:hypothetical protein
MIEDDVHVPENPIRFIKGKDKFLKKKKLKLLIHEESDFRSICRPFPCAFGTLKNTPQILIVRGAGGVNANH